MLRIIDAVGIADVHQSAAAGVCRPVAGRAFTDGEIDVIRQIVVEQVQTGDIIDEMLAVRDQPQFVAGRTDQRALQVVHDGERQAAAALVWRVVRIGVVREDIDQRRIQHRDVAVHGDRGTPCRRRFGRARGGIHFPLSGHHIGMIRICRLLRYDERRRVEARGRRIVAEDDAARPQRIDLHTGIVLGIDLPVIADEIDGGIGIGRPTQTSPAAELIALHHAFVVVNVQQISAVPVGPERHAAREIIADAAAEIAGRARLPVIAELQVDHAFRLLRGRPRGDIDRADRRVPAIKRALRAAQDFDRRDVGHLAVNGPSDGDKHAVKEHAHIGLRARIGAGGPDVADDDLRIAVVVRLRDLQARNIGRQFGNRRNVVLFEHVAAEGGDRHADGLNVLLTLLRRHDNRFDSVRTRVRLREGRCRVHAH